MTIYNSAAAFSASARVGIFGYDYAVIVNGVITDIVVGASSIPTSTTTTLYVDITSYSPVPIIGDYYDEKCDTFSSTPPSTPPGDVAPPLPPGGGGNPPGGPGGPTNPPAPPPPNLLPVHIFFHANAANAFPTLTNAPYARTAIPGTPEMVYTPMDPTRCVEIMLCTYVGTVGGGCGKVGVEYTTDFITWLPLCANNGPYLSVSSVGAQAGGRTPIDPAARLNELIWLRLIVEAGNGVADPVLYNTCLIAYMDLDPTAIMPGGISPVTSAAAALFALALIGDDLEGGFGNGIPNYADEAAYTAFHSAKQYWQAEGVNAQIAPGGETVWEFDSTYSLGGKRTIVSYIGDNDLATGTLVGAGPRGYEQKGLRLGGAQSSFWDDIWIRAAYEIECGMQLPTDGTGVNATRGLRLLALSHYNSVVSDVGLTSIQLKLSDGEIRLVTTNDSSTVGSTLDYQKDTLGPSSDLIGAGPKDIILHAKKMSNTSWRIRVYIGDVGAKDIPRYGEVTRTVTSNTTDKQGTYQLVQDILPVTGTNTTRRKVWLGRWDVTPESNSPNPYQVIP